MWTCHPWHWRSVGKSVRRPAATLGQPHAAHARRLRARRGPPHLHLKCPAFRAYLALRAWWPPCPCTLKFPSQLRVVFSAVQVHSSTWEFPGWPRPPLLLQPRAGRTLGTGEPASYNLSGAGVGVGPCLTLLIVLLLAGDGGRVDPSRARSAPGPPPLRVARSARTRASPPAPLPARSAGATDPSGAPEEAKARLHPAPQPPTRPPTPRCAPRVRRALAPPAPPPRRPARAPGGPGPHSRLPRGARGQLGCESEGRWRNGGRAGAGGGGERPRRLRCRSTYRSTSPPYFAAVSLPQDLPQYFAAVLRRSLCLCFCRSNSLLYFAAIFCQSTCCSTSRRAGAGWGVRWGGGVTGGLAPVVASAW